MKHTVLTVASLILAALATGCQSPGYWGNRARDAQDVVTASVGIGIGAKARVGPFHAGIIADHDVLGVPDGAFHRQHMGMPSPGVALEWEAGPIPVPLPYSEGLLKGWGFGYDAFVGPQPCDGRRLKADYEVRSLVPFVATTGLRHQYYTHVEAVAGLGPSVRLGFNVGEFADFILGWTTLDIFSDDHTSASK
jgi:hypothetical protein